MSELIYIPCYSRPEFLFLCLEHIQKASEDLPILFHIDFDFNPDIIEVINSFNLDKEILYNRKHKYKNKLPVNILEGYKKAVAQNYDTIYYIEEDIFISKDFFKWHRAVHEQKELFCSIAIENHNRKIPKGEADQYYTSHRDYTAWGVGWKSEVLKDLVLPHANPLYYQYPARYLQKRFRNSRMSPMHIEQAGLIRRIQEGQKLPIAFPYQGRAFHAGFYGKNRKGNLKGSWQEKVYQLRTIVYHPDEIKRVALRKEYFQDSKPVALSHDWKRLKFIKHFS